MIDAKTKKIIVEILKKHGVKRAAVFGSFARGEQKKRSDIDILVKTPSNMSLLGFIGMENELKDALKRKIDLAGSRAVSAGWRVCRGGGGGRRHGG